MSELIPKVESELQDAIRAIQQPRTNFQLEHFVVGQHDTEPRRWMQCVLELQLKIHALKRAAIVRRQIERKIVAFESLASIEAGDEAELLRLDLEAHELATLGAIREAETLYSIFKSFQKIYTREELDEAEAEYWQKRIMRQARQEINATGAIGVGNQDALEQIGVPPESLLLESQKCMNHKDRMQSGNSSTFRLPSPSTPHLDLKT